MCMFCISFALLALFASQYWANMKSLPPKKLVHYFSILKPKAKGNQILCKCYRNDL